jgi:hypothetical protein
VPQVNLTNNSNRYIYIMGGEILTGCRQDRIVGRDVLIAPGRRNVVVPVYCVEQGRWSYESDNFYSKKNLGTYELRREAQKAKGSAQSSIWRGIQGLNQRLRVHSGTHAYQDTYEQAAIKREITGYERRMQAVPYLHRDTVGVVVGVGGRVVSVDIFANPTLFKQLWPKILKSSALSALSNVGGGTITQEQAAQFLRRLHDKYYTRKYAIDLGEEFSAADSQANANALVYRQAVIHLAAFSEEGSYQISEQWGESERRIPVLRR